VFITFETGMKRSSCHHLPLLYREPKLQNCKKFFARTYDAYNPLKYSMYVKRPTGVIYIN
jgi:hypothetical protein